MSRLYRSIHLDDALELFDPATGHRVRVDAAETRGLRQLAPRSVQFALTNHCNLACGFCSRPLERRSTWTVASALEVLADLDRLGVAEVAFGGGEPLVFKGFFDLVDRLVRETRLAVHFTTNGVLLTDDAILRLRGKVGEIRVSLYDDNDWRTTLARLVRHGMRFGVNVLATPERLPGLPALLDELGALGCRDVLLLPVLGHRELALDGEQARRLGEILAPRRGIKLGVCWGPELAHLPRLFASDDCGAGREFLEITSDRRVRACSFHAESLPFDTAADVIGLWTAARPELTSPAGCEGCPRGCAIPRVTDVRPRIRVYTAFASNNSGSYTLLGSFATSERAAEITALLTRLAADMDAAGEGNPLRELLAAAGIPAPEDIGRTDDWPESWGGPPEAIQVDAQVWWYTHQTITMPEQVGQWIYAQGGRVQAEIDHAHHPLLAHLDLWPDSEWSARNDAALQPLIDALWLGAFADDGLAVRIRVGDHRTIEILWFAPTPDRMRELTRTAATLGLRCRLTLTEALTKKVDLDALWPPPGP